ncbi:SPOSA6832_01634 [Sporobolomyces salmonicolor]|uniref:SPOSA6832_01634-mRNA-1:cds n=1 Tax=Sporidiobolus salmonicolor TaxID=5005 RepID=A0A0D6EJF9_SPOSA|nr:SPOSA6832_01634 [Sporobolomyces salmonicolor]
MPPKSRSSSSKASSAPKAPSLGFSSSKKSAAASSKAKKGAAQPAAAAPSEVGAKLRSELVGRYPRLYKEALKRMGPPIHRDGMDDIEIILRQFDASEEYGPASRIRCGPARPSTPWENGLPAQTDVASSGDCSRLERFERAEKLGLQPDPEIGEILRSESGRNRTEYALSVFNSRSPVPVLFATRLPYPGESSKPVLPSLSLSPPGHAMEL